MTRPKLIEIRDAGTFIPALAIQLRPDKSESTYLLRRAGYVNGTAVLLFHLHNGVGHADPWQWGGTRTMLIAHLVLAGAFDSAASVAREVQKVFPGVCPELVAERARAFDDIAWGDVLDVEYIIGVTDTPKRSEQETAPV